MKYKFNPPYLIKKIFPSFQWESNINKILLTFDDGPVPETTPVILQCLSSYKIKAAFFCVGENIYKYPELYRRIVDEGHLVCNHTFNHKAIPQLNRNELIQQIEKFNSIIKKQSGKEVLYFRPPYGKFSLSSSLILKQNNLKIIMWSLLTNDYQNDINVVKFAVNKYLTRNSIVVLHDSLRSKDIIADSIQYIINECSYKGFQIGDPAECLR
ncbi:MAG TPA: polysaccharide deacetylase family protein [Ignavibacteriaceae bacterium]|nr:polysaccharide deacetylase family protein [Ignavibacteriaceae bacterium]